MSSVAIVEARSSANDAGAALLAAVKIEDMRIRDAALATATRAIAVWKVHVVDEAILVVVDAVARDLACVGPTPTVEVAVRGQAADELRVGVEVGQRQPGTAPGQHDGQRQFTQQQRRDLGPGIADELMPRLFQRGERGARAQAASSSRPISSGWAAISSSLGSCPSPSSA